MKAILARYLDFSLRPCWETYRAYVPAPGAVMKVKVEKK
jgi:hypothetical protein